MTYYAQLKEKYPDNIKQAYKEYILSKTIYRTFYCAEDAPEFIKEGMQLQSKLNTYAEQLIEGKSATLMEVLGMNSEKFFDYFIKKEVLFDFLELDRSSVISHASGTYEINLKKAIPSDLSWEALEAIIIEEKNNVPILKDEEAIVHLKNIADTYGLNSVTYGKVRTTQESINKLGDSLFQLKEVVECNAEQVGLKKFNIFLDVNEFAYAGQATDYEDQMKLYINERLSHDAFAHEWLHGTDMLNAKLNAKNYHMYSEAKKGKVHELLESLNVGYKEDIQAIKTTVLTDTKKYIDKIVERFDAMASINEPGLLKQKLQEEIKDIVAGKFDSQKIIRIVNEHMKDTNGCSSYVLTELSMLDNFLKNKDEDFKHSYFYEYAQEMEKSLKTTGLIKNEYSTLVEERYARAFESYTQVKLEEKGIKNDIAHADVSAWTPKAIETIRNKGIWDEVLKEMRDMMETYLPSQSTIEHKQESNISGVKANIGQIRRKLSNNVEKLDNGVAVKIK